MGFKGMEKAVKRGSLIFKLHNSDSLGLMYQLKSESVSSREEKGTAGRTDIVRFIGTSEETTLILSPIAGHGA